MRFVITKKYVWKSNATCYYHVLFIIHQFYMEREQSIYCIRSLARCVTNLSDWLPLNERFRCNYIKTNRNVIFVLCVVALLIFGDLGNEHYIGQVIESNLGTKLHWSILILKKLRHLFIISSSVVRAKRHLCFERNTNRVLKLYWMYWIYKVSTYSL